MVSSRALTVEQYLAELPPERRDVIATLRELINHHLPEGFVESMAYGMIGWGIPLSRYPDTYNGQPIGPLALAAQKHNYALYTMVAYMSPDVDRDLRDAFARAGLRLDMGKSCIRFRSLDQLPLEAIARLVESTSVEEFIALYEASRHGGRVAKRRAAKPAARKSKPAVRRAAKQRPAAKKVPAKRAAGKKPARKAAKQRR